MRWHSGFLLVSVLSLVAAGECQTTTLGLDPGKLYDKGMNLVLGSNVSQSGTDAIEYFRRSADLGYAPAQVALGYFYETGRFVAREPGHALSYYRKAAQQGNPLGQWLAGRIVFLGLTGPRDLNEATELVKPAADQGDPFAQYLMGKIKLERGDWSSAADWLRQAAEQGLPQAQKHLAFLLRDGQGIAQDKSAAYVWMLLAQMAGDQTLNNDLAALEADLGSTETDRAKNQAREIEASVARSAVAHGCTGWSGEFDEVPTPPTVDLQRFCR